MRHLLKIAVVIFLLAPAEAGAQSQSKSGSAHALAQVTKQKRSSTVLYYLDFTAGTFSPVTKQAIKSVSSKIDDIQPEDEQLIYRLVKEAGGRGAFNGSIVRLLIQKGDATDSVYVDGEGHVLLGKKQYIMTPLNFLLLDHLLSRLMQQKVHSGNTQDQRSVPSNG